MLDRRHRRQNSVEIERNPMKAKPVVEKERLVNGRYAHVRYPRTATSAEELAEMRRRAWRQQGVLSLRLEDIPDDWLRAGLLAWATAQYGPRPGAPVSETG